MADPRDFALPGPFGRALVLRVDDESALPDALRESHSRELYGVVSTNDLEVALELVQTRFVHLVLADYRMDRINGAELLDLVRASSPATMRIFIMESPRDFLVERAVEVGLLEVRHQPWDPIHLARIIKDRLGIPHREEAREDLPAWEKN